MNEISAARAPCLVFSRKDQLQATWLRKALGTDVVPPVHWLPSSQAFVDAALAGLGWGMNMERVVREHIRSGHLMALEPSEPLEVPLYWQQSRIVGPLLADLTSRQPRLCWSRCRLRGWLINLSPHPEEQRSCVSKEGPESTGDALVLRDGLTASSG
jgi:DNA-binding transcriptional LysR family regulator